MIGVVQKDKAEAFKLSPVSDYEEEQPQQAEQDGSCEPSSGERQDAVMIGLGGLGPINRKLTPKIWKMAQL